MTFKVVTITLCVIALYECAPMDILMFGGNGFIGGHSSEILISEGHKLTLINRDNWPWDVGSTVKPKVHVTANVDRTAENAVELFEEKILIPRNYKPFDVVIDFSAYNLKAFRPFYDKLKHSCKLYVYISTDSIYEVCDPSLKSENSNLLEEIHSRRPNDEETANKLRENDKYGHKKLEIEEFLIAQREQNSSSCPFLILRLPDVLGERDSTQRWWKYQMWLKYSDYFEKPVVIPYFCRTLKSSYVYVKDIARFLLLVTKNSSRFEDQILNFAFEEPKSLRELLVHMKEVSRVSARIDSAGETDDPDLFYFPSVTRNGGLSVVRLKNLCPEFEFTPWETMIYRVVEFYQKAFLEFPRERDSVADSLCRDLNFDSRQCQKFTNLILVEAERRRKKEL